MGSNVRTQRGGVKTEQLSKCHELPYTAPLLNMVLRKVAALPPEHAYPPMAVSMPKTTPEQDAIGKKLRQKICDHIGNRRGGITFVGPKGVGKTRIVGVVHSKAPKDETTLNLFAACKTDHADKQAEEVGVATGCKPLTLGRLLTVKTALALDLRAALTVVSRPMVRGLYPVATPTSAACFSAWSVLHAAKRLSVVSSLGALE